MEMLEYIYEQPELFARSLQDRAAVTAPFVELFETVKPDRLYLVASGTSRNAAAAAAPFMQQILGIEVTAQVPSRLFSVFGSRPMFVYVSQGGNSTNTLAAMERFAKYPSIAMTGDPGRICDVCSRYLKIPCGPETAGPKTKGYTITVLTLYLMALEAAHSCGWHAEEPYEKYVEVLQQAGRNLQDTVDAAAEWQRCNDEAHRQLQVVYLVGKGQAMEIAREGALKMQETLLIPTAAFEFEEFLHGPTSSLNKQVAGFYLLPPVHDPDYARMQGLVQYHRACGAWVCTVGPKTTEWQTDCVVHTTGYWYTQPFEAIVPMQIVSALVPKELGIGDDNMQAFRKLDKLLGIKFKSADGETEYGQTAQ